MAQENQDNESRLTVGHLIREAELAFADAPLCRAVLPEMQFKNRCAYFIQRTFRYTSF